MPIAKRWLWPVILSVLALGAGCSQQLKGRVQDGSILTMKRYSVAGVTYGNNERWIVQADLPLAGNSSAKKAVLAWLESFEAASGPFTFDPAIRVDFFTEVARDDYGIYLNKKADRCYICTPAVSGLSSGIYKCDPKAFAKVDQLLLDQPEPLLPETISEEK